jgi:ParB family transcriptional regulator, chromosome partitioning protein
MSFVTPELPNLLRNSIIQCGHCKRRVLAADIGRPKRFCSTRCRMAAHRKAKAEMRPNEFYTPAYVIETARACMGGIDLDPASCAVANETVQATRFYSVKDDGLKQPWFGRVWLNPPYARFGPAFVHKAVAEFKAGVVEQAIVLLRSNHVTTGWFHDAMRVEFFQCTPRKRINFDSPNYVVSSATSGSILIGIGIPRERFEEHFGKLGKIAFVGAP